MKNDYHISILFQYAIVPIRAAVLILMGASSLIIGSKAHGLCISEMPQPVDIRMDLGPVILHPDMPAGTIISVKKFPIPSSRLGYCYGWGTMIGNFSSSYRLSSLGNYIYETNIHGIGLRLYRESNDGKIRTFYPHNLTEYHYGITKAYLAGGYFTVEVIRLPGPTGAGTLNSGLYSTYYADGTGLRKPVLTSHVYGDGISIINSTCSIDAGSRDITIDMGTVARNDFSGVGSTLNERDFNIRLNCLGGNDSIWAQKRGDVSLLFTYSPHAQWGNQGVIQPEQGRTSASGVGIQLISNSTHSPVRNNEYVYAGRLSPSRSETLNVPLKARYYQTDSHIAGGNVSALATFTLVYQ